MEHTLQIVPEDEWHNKSEVTVCERYGCGRSFGPLVRPENCHVCGMVMCEECLKCQLTLPGKSVSEPVPLCDVCTLSISEAQEEVKDVHDENKELLRRLSEQQAETERLLMISSSLRSENKQLLNLTEMLKKAVEQLKMKNTVVDAPSIVPPTGASFSESLLPLANDLFVDVVMSPTSGKNLIATANTSNEMSNADLMALEEELKKKQKALELREAALQEALKKVSSDSLRVATQRTELQGEKRNLRAQLAREFKTVIEEECLRLQDVYLEELTVLGEKFAAWRRDATDAVAVQRREQMAIMSQQEEAHKERLAQVEEALAKARLLHKEEIAKKQEHFNEDLLLLQGSLDAIRHELAIERGQSKVAQGTVDVLKLTLQEERQRHEFMCAELRDRLFATQSFGNLICSIVYGTLRAVHCQTESSSSSSSLCAASIVPAMNAVLSEWQCVANTLLSQHSASLTTITLGAYSACTLLELSSQSASTPAKTAVEKKPITTGKAGHPRDVKKLRPGLNCSSCPSEEFGVQVNEQLPEVSQLRQSLEQQTEELQHLREKLSRTEKALVRASKIERRLTQQLQKEQELKNSCTHEHSSGNSSSSSVAPVVWVTQVIGHVGLYIDEFASIFGDALLGLYHTSTKILQEEWTRRRVLTRRNTIAFEETTASIRAFQNELKQREATVVQGEEVLFMREQEVRARQNRLFELSMALRIVAGRLRAVSTGEKTNDLS